PNPDYVPATEPTEAQGDPTVVVPNPEHVPADSTPNSVVVVIDGETVASESFGKSYAAEFAFPSQYEAATYSVIVTAWNDPDGTRGWTRTFEGTSEPCALPALPEESRVPGEWSTPLV